MIKSKNERAQAFFVNFYLQAVLFERNSPSVLSSLNEQGTFFDISEVVMCIVHAMSGTHSLVHGAQSQRQWVKEKHNE